MDVFISHPMRGKTNKEINEMRKKAEDEIRKAVPADVAIRIISQITEVAYVGHEINRPSLWHLGRSLQLMSTADAVYFVDSWQNYPGCRVEHDCAENYGIKIMHD